MPARKSPVCPYGPRNCYSSASRKRVRILSPAGWRHGITDRDKNIATMSKALDSFSRLATE